MQSNNTWCLLRKLLLASNNVFRTWLVSNLVVAHSFFSPAASTAPAPAITAPAALHLAQCAFVHFIEFLADFLFADLLPFLKFALLQQYNWKRKLC